RFYSKIHSFLSNWDPEIIQLKDLNTLLENLNFAEKMDYKTLQHEQANQIIYGVFCLVALGSMDYEKGTEHIARLMQKVRFLTHASNAGSYMLNYMITSLKRLLESGDLSVPGFFGNFVIG
ncbi:hypothetical protein MP638_006152, partial [Amoeboaphelidium occidentale]